MPPAVPDFPEFREPLISDAEVFHRLANRVQPVTSELTFTNIFVWRSVYSFELTMLNGNLCVFSQRGDQPPFFLPPLGDNELTRTVETLFGYMRDRGYDPLISRAPEPVAHRLVEGVPSVTIEEDRDNADYVYLSSDLAELPGRRYHKKKNHISRFREAYAFEYRPLTPELIPAARDFQTAWCDVRGCFTPEHTSLAQEHAVILETLDNFDKLRAVGGAILVEGDLVGFTIGDPLNADTFVIHFEKANQEYRGAYQILNQQFCTQIHQQCRYINREQDLGEPGLRQAKQSYHPDHLVMKYSVRISG